MSDNSRYCVECERLAGELDALRAELEQMRDAFEGMNLARDDEQRRRVEVEAELERMRPIVEAAAGYADCCCSVTRFDNDGGIVRGDYPSADDCPHATTLLDAVDAYRNGHTSSEERTHCEHGTWLAEDVCLACPVDPNDSDDPRNSHTSNEEQA